MKLHKNFLHKVSVLAFAGTLLSTFSPSSGWAMEEDRISKVPPRVLSYLFSFLDVQSLGRVARVSKNLKKASEQDICWKNRAPNVESKADYKEYLCGPSIIMYNNTKGSINYQTNIAFGSGMHTYNSKSQTFDICPIRVTLEKNKETAIFVRKLSKKIENVNHDEIYGVTSVPGNMIAVTKSSPVTMFLPNEMVDTPSNIFEIINPKLKFIISEYEMGTLKFFTFTEYDENNLHEYNKVLEKHKKK